MQYSVTFTEILAAQFHCRRLNTQSAKSINFQNKRLCRLVFDYHIKTLLNCSQWGMKQNQVAVGTGNSGIPKPALLSKCEN